LGCPDVDFLVLGEGEKPIKELIEKLNAGESPAGMKSLAYRDEHGNPVVNNNRSWIEDLDEHVLPARNKVDMKKFNQDPTEGLRVWWHLTW